MKKLILPELIVNNELPDTMTQKEFYERVNTRFDDYVPEYKFEICGLLARSRLVYSTFYKKIEVRISAAIATSYWGSSIVETEEFYCTTYAQWKKAVKDMTAQLIKRWKEWVRGLYEEE